MTYRLSFLSKEVDNFKLEIEAPSTATFLELNDLIISSLKYSKGEMTSFFSCDDEWEPYQEITLVEMDVSSENDSYVMENTRLEEFLADEGDKMMFVFDILNNRSLYLTLREIKPGTIAKPKCTKLSGQIPVQIKMEEFLTGKKKDSKEFLDEDFYGSDEYSDDEIDSEGFSEVDMSEIDI